ncbi:uncharacterized protein LOC122460845 [Dermochelys coriacea]|uniref:uncharacterized protein LOC122460845 n=1 Tax=Dermochelys coriacea TaxID=27794 RepID=UPI001CA95551|nr:uncharacterized protein LOC122460845 [Dermochelys coriacea]
MPLLCWVALLLWEFCLAYSILLQASYLPGVQNVLADRLSRQFLMYEWSIHPDIVHSIFRSWGFSRVDLFAMQANRKCPTFCSFRGHSPGSIADAFMILWSSQLLYAFPLIYKVLLKVHRDKADVILVAQLGLTSAGTPPSWACRSSHRYVYLSLLTSSCRITVVSFTQTFSRSTSWPGGSMVEPGRAHLFGPSEAGASGEPQAVYQGHIQSKMEKVLYLGCSKAGAPTAGFNPLFSGLSPVLEGPASGIRISQGPPRGHLGVSGSLVFAHPIVGHFLKGLEKINPPMKPPVVAWDLNLVLSHLMGPLFEPLASCSLLLPLLEGCFSSGYHLGMMCV